MHCKAIFKPKKRRVSWKPCTFYTLSRLVILQRYVGSNDAMIYFWCIPKHFVAHLSRMLCATRNVTCESSHNVFSHTCTNASVVVCGKQYHWCATECTMNAQLRVQLIKNLLHNQRANARSMNAHLRVHVAFCFFTLYAHLRVHLEYSLLRTVPSYAQLSAGLVTTFLRKCTCNCVYNVRAIARSNGMHRCSIYTHLRLRGPSTFIFTIAYFVVSDVLQVKVSCGQGTPMYLMLDTLPDWNSNTVSNAMQLF